MSRIGVFICHCGTNIAGTVDVEAVAEAAKSMPTNILAPTPVRQESKKLLKNIIWIES